MKLFRNAARLAACSIALISALQAHAAQSLSGTITFSKRPPMVALLYVPADKAPEQAPVVDQVDKQFTEAMVVASPGAHVDFKNSDSVDHNIFANDVEHHATFDVGLMPPGGHNPIAVNWDENAVIRVGCKIHPRMRMYIASVTADYAKVIEFEPRNYEYPFTLSGIPDGAKKIVLRIPKYDTVEIDIDAQSHLQAQIMKNGEQRGQITLTRGAD